MTLGNEELYNEAVALSTNVDDNFQELGRVLCKLLDGDPELFAQLWEKTDLGRRKTYYLVEVSRVFDPLIISQRLKRIGWKELQIIAKHVEELLKHAETCSAEKMEAHMRGEKSLDNAHCMLKYFSPKPYTVLEDAQGKDEGQ
jgi:hypothetical protein